MMNKNKILLLGLIITVALGGLTGCAGEITTTQPETTTPQVVTGQEETSSEEETTEKTTEKTTEENETDGGVMGYVDAEDICKHISINGKVVEFPWTLNELGDEYSFDYINNEDNDNTYGATLIYNGKSIGVVQIIEDGEIDRESKMYYISPYSVDTISIYDISTETTEEDIIKRFGISEDSSSSQLSNSYYYSNEEIWLGINFSKSDGIISGITISLTEKYLEKEK